VVDRVEIRSSVARRIVSWQLSDFLFTEVHLRLRETLRALAPRCLVRTREPFDGLCYPFSVVDPENRLREHLFVFQVVFTQDEMGLIVTQAGHMMRTGL
jgi:hypothetical protein